MMPAGTTSAWRKNVYLHVYNIVFLLMLWGNTCGLLYGAPEALMGYRRHMQDSIVYPYFILP